MALRNFLEQEIFRGRIFVLGDWSMSLAVDPQEWESWLPDLIPTHGIEKNQRYHYLCHALTFDWRSALPAGYMVRRMDRALLADTNVVIPEPVKDWFDIEEVWGSLENFLEKGISYCVVHEGKVVAWCNCDCVAGDRVDVGIFTHPHDRRRGLGSIAVAATVEACLENGYSAVGWHCNADNIPSWKMAEKVGFQFNREYAYYFYIYDPVDHLAELGWYYYKRGEYARTVDYYKQVFTRRRENPDYYYHLAASAWALLGNKEKSLRYLNEAVRAGWKDAEYTRAQEEFSILHGESEWDQLLRRMLE
jgi:GNAT superfamily N-acetyltransferase